MIEFKPSAQLIKKMLDNLRASGIEISEAEISETALEEYRTLMMEMIRGTVASKARSVESPSFEEYAVIKDGKFVPELDDCIAGTLTPEGEAGDKLLQELAEEFLKWLEHTGSQVVFGPKGPIEKLYVHGRSMFAQVRPEKPHQRNLTFVCSTEVE